MDWIWTAILLVIFTSLLQTWISKKKNLTKKLPPGPRGYPILGSLNLLGEFPHRDLEKLAKQYGSIMHMRLGLMTTVVVSSPDAAEYFLKTYDLAFASRPPLQASKHVSYEQRNLSFAPYGPYWRNIRKMCTLELLSSFKINSFKSMRKEEMGLLIEYIQESACARAAVDLSAKVSSLSTDMSCLMVFGKKYMDKDLDERGFKAVIQEVMQLPAIPNLGDYIPFIAPFDFQGLTKRMKAVSKIVDTFFEKIIDEHVSGCNEGRTKDFVDVMLSLMETQENDYKVERANIKAIMLGKVLDFMSTVISAAGHACSVDGHISNSSRMGTFRAHQTPKHDEESAKLAKRKSRNEQNG